MIGRILIAGALLIAARPICAGDLQVLYRVTPLRDLPGGSSGCIAADINTAGQACGTGFPSAGSRPVRWDSGPIADLGILPGCPGGSGEGESINDAGEVVGVSHAVNCEMEAFLWSPESGMIGLGDLPGAPPPYSWATGINNLSKVTGWSWSDSEGERGPEAFLWDTSTGMIGLGDLPGGQRISVGQAINDSSWVTGWSCSSRGCEPFLWTPERGMIGLGDLNGGAFADGTGYDINNLGQVVGIANSSNSRSEAFLWDPVEGMIGLGWLRPEDRYAGSSAYGVNDLGEVVGWSSYGLFPPLNEAFVWDRAHGMRRLMDLLDARAVYPYNYIPVAHAINNAGQIVASTSGEAVLLTPFLVADMNCDGSLNSFDIQPFVLTLQWLSGDDAARKEYEQTYPGCHGDWAADANQDGSVNQFDIQPFIDLLAG